MAIIPDSVTERGATVSKPYCRINFRGHVMAPGQPRQLEYIVVRRQEVDDNGDGMGVGTREAWLQVGALRRFAPAYSAGAANEMSQAYDHLKATDPQFRSAQDV